MNFGVLLEKAQLLCWTGKGFSSISKCHVFRGKWSHPKDTFMMKSWIEEWAATIFGEGRRTKRFLGSLLNRDFIAFFFWIEWSQHRNEEGLQKRYIHIYIYTARGDSVCSRDESTLQKTCTLHPMMLWMCTAPRHARREWTNSYSSSQRNSQVSWQYYWNESFWHIPEVSLVIPFHAELLPASLLALAHFSNVAVS